MSPSNLARDEALLVRIKAERAGDRVVRSLQLFVQRRASGGLVLLRCAILAFALANSPWAWAYRQMLHGPLAASVGKQMLRLELRHWINDGLMAICYTAPIDWRGVALIAAFVLALWVAKRIGALRGSIYLLLGLCLWASYFMSGLHATLAGVLAALFEPARVKLAPGALPQVIRRGADDIAAQALNNEPGAIGGSLDAATAPLQRFEHGVQPWVTYGILPAFGLFNAGVAIDAAVLSTLPTGAT